MPLSRAARYPDAADSEAAGCQGSVLAFKFYEVAAASTQISLLVRHCPPSTASETLGHGRSFFGRWAMTAGFSPAVHFQHSPLQPLAKLVNSPANSRYLSDSRQSHRISKSKSSRGQVCKQRPFSEAGLRQQRPCTCTTASGSASLNPEEPQVRFSCRVKRSEN